MDTETFNSEATPFNTFETTLIGFGGINVTNTSLKIGDKIGDGESGIVRNIEIKIDDNSNLAALKTFKRQDKARESGNILDEDESKAFDRAYETHLIIHESLKRAGVRVIPTFKLARDEKSKHILGVVMTNLQITPLIPNTKVFKVDSTKTDEHGAKMSSLSRSSDITLARQIGLELHRDSWMLQYSSGQMGLGKIFPQAVVSDIIGINVTDASKFKKFLSRNKDLEKEVADNTVIMRMFDKD